MRRIRTKNLILSYGEVTYPNADCDVVCGCHQIHREFENLGVTGGERSSGHLICKDLQHIIFVSDLEHLRAKGLVLAQKPDENSNPNDNEWTELYTLAKSNARGFLKCSFKSGRFQFTPKC